MVVHAVKADDNGAFEFRVFEGFVTFDEFKKGADREGEEVKDSQEEGGEYEQERAGESEAGAGSDVGQGGDAG